MIDPRFTPGPDSPLWLTALGEADLYMEKKLEYDDFLRSKMVHTPRFGFHVDLSEITTNFLDGTIIKGIIYMSIVDFLSVLIYN